MLQRRLLRIVQQRIKLQQLLLLPNKHLSKKIYFSVTSGYCLETLSFRKEMKLTDKYLVGAVTSK
jgi:hypothetical protein